MNLTVIMVKIIGEIGELNTQQLLDVYLQSHENYGREHFPKLDAHEQLVFAQEDFRSYLREDFFLQKDAFYAVWIVDGVYQCALRLEPYRDGMLLQALETAPNARRKGYAGSLIAEVLKHLQGRSYKAVYSHVEKHNIPSLAVHYKCGFQKLTDSATYLDGTVTQRSCTLCYYL